MTALAPRSTPSSTGCQSELLSAAVHDDQASFLVAAAWLHDVGYAEGLNRPAFIHSTELSLYAMPVGRRRCAIWSPITPEVASSPPCGTSTTRSASSPSRRTSSPTR